MSIGDKEMPMELQDGERDGPRLLAGDDEDPRGESTRDGSHNEDRGPSSHTEKNEDDRGESMQRYLHEEDRRSSAGSEHDDSRRQRGLSSDDRNAVCNDFSGAVKPATPKRSR